MPKEIISQEEVTLAQVKKILSKRSKDGELSFQQSITLEHATGFAKLAPVASEKLVERLMRSYEFSRPKAVQLVNIGPTTEEEIKTVLGSQSTDLTDEQLIEIVDIIVKATS